MAKSPGESSALFRAAFLFLLLSFIFHVIGFSTPNWTEVALGDSLESGFGYRTGLWKKCVEVLNIVGNCGDSIFQGQGWFLAVQTFESLGLACLIVALIISSALLIAVSNPRLARVNVHVCVFAGIFIIIGTSTYTWKTEFQYLGYSYWLCWCSSLALVVAVILLECDHKRSSARETNTTLVNVVSAEYQPQDQHGYHSYPMQQQNTQQHYPRAYSAHGRPGQPVPHAGQHATQGHAMNAPPPAYDKAVNQQ